MWYFEGVHKINKAPMEGSRTCQGVGFRREGKQSTRLRNLEKASQQQGHTELSLWRWQWLWQAEEGEQGLNQPLFRPSNIGEVGAALLCSKNMSGAGRHHTATADGGLSEAARSPACPWICWCENHAPATARRSALVSVSFSEGSADGSWTRWWLTQLWKWSGVTWANSLRCSTF